MNLRTASLTGAGEPHPVTELFHRVNSVIPDEQQLVSIPPQMPATEALALLDHHGFSQLPVVIGREVLGLFSHRSFAKTVVDLSQKPPKGKPPDPLELVVEHCMNPKPPFARVTDEFAEWFDTIDRHDSILVGEPNRLQGIVTAMDILRYLYRVASPFVLIGEVELSLRALMGMAVNEQALGDCAKRCLSHQYEADKVPRALQDMTFNDYIQIIGHGENWTYFSAVFGGSRERTRARLEQLRDVRNVIFHFRREITVEEHQTLAANRDWMLMRVRAAEARLQEIAP